MTSPTTVTAAMGRCAAATAARASAMPAPQVEVVQLHSISWMSPGPAGTWQFGMFGSGETGNGTVPSWSRAFNSEGVRLPFTETINAAIPVTIGEEKLVPTFELNWSV